MTRRQLEMTPGRRVRWEAWAAYPLTVAGCQSTVRARNLCSAQGCGHSRLVHKRRVTHLVEVGWRSIHLQPDGVEAEERVFVPRRSGPASVPLIAQMQLDILHFMGSTMAPFCAQPS